MNGFHQSMKRRQGFTLIEMILTLFTVSLCALLAAQLLGVMKRAGIVDDASEDAIAIRQLQLLFAQGEHYELSHDVCQMYYHGEWIRLERYEHQLVKRPGFEVLLQNLDDLAWKRDGSCVRLQWKRSDRMYEKVVGCE